MKPNDPLKILHINVSDISGGAARAAYRLHTALRGIGVESRMLVQYKNSDYYHVLCPESIIEKGMALLRPTLDGLPVRLYKNRSKSIFSPASIPSYRLIQKINSSNTDVVHLHWIAGGMLRIEELARIAKPIVWTLHDMWAFTGGCHYDNGCGKYLNTCELCPILGSFKNNDLSARILKRKERIFSQLHNMIVVGVSRWLASCAENSALLKDKHIVNLSNPIDTHTFRPIEKATARDMLGLSADKKLVLFGAINATNDPRKGFSALSQALRQLRSENVELVIFGASRPENEPDFCFPVHYLGRLYDDLTLRTIYSAVDVMVVPSLQEAFGQTASESMTCGTPVVAFGATGLLDIVEHKQNGYLAKPFDLNDLALGIDWILDHSSPDTLAQNARQKVIDNFEASKVAGLYVELYEKVLGKRSK